MGARGQIERLQQWRRRPVRSKLIGDGINALDRRVRQLHRRLGGFVEAWEQHLPEKLHRQTRVERIRGSVVEVIVTSSALCWELDRRLQEGLLDELRGTCRGTLTRVRLRVGRLEGTLVRD